MKKSRFLILTSILFMQMIFITGSQAGSGEVLYKAKACQRCHGPDGNTPLLPSYPKLAGQNAQYLIQQIKDIRDGKRNNALSAAMKPMISNLRDTEIEDIANWLASQ